LAEGRAKVKRDTARSAAKIARIDLCFLDDENKRMVRELLL